MNDVSGFFIYIIVVDYRIYMHQVPPLQVIHMMKMDIALFMLIDDLLSSREEEDSCTKSYWMNLYDNT